MLAIKTAEHNGIKNNYAVFGNGSINIVIEIGLGAAIGEWWHIAERLSKNNTVLLYERSCDTTVLRTPESIAKELHSLLGYLQSAEKVLLIAHSQGGLYAQQFARLYPQMVQGLLLLDPLSANDSQYKEVLSPEEQKKSGFDKSGNLVLMNKLARLHLGFIIKAFMKKAPPFFYYNGFSKDASDNILSSLAKPNFTASAIQEYRLAHEAQYTASLAEADTFPDLPLVLITHASAFSIEETMRFGQTDRAFAEKVENLWQSLMQEYLAFGSKTHFLQAKNSGHYIHLTEPAL
ncbi:MAG: alpha/beta hydrolase, partial [Eubacteriales bacterium]|nr:alpha/beta hydrolase [Eubacteriales bacterium]